MKKEVVGAHTCAQVIDSTQREVYQAPAIEVIEMEMEGSVMMSSGGKASRYEDGGEYSF